MAAVPRHRRAEPQADPADPHVALRTLGLSSVHPDLCAAERGRHQPRDQPARRVRVSHVDREQPLRSGRGDRHRHGAHHGLAHLVLSPIDGSTGGAVTSTLETMTLIPQPERVEVSSRKPRHNIVPNLLALVVFLISTFPVYWMVLTSFRRGVDIQRPTPQFVPSPGTLQNYRKVFERDYFWTAVRNSLTVTLSVLALALLLAFLAAVAVSRFRFRG